VTIAHPDATTEAALAALAPLSLEPVPLSFERALVDYMEGRRKGGGSLLRSLGS
jgi:hypothetical protein